MEHMMLLVTYRMLPGQRDAFLQEVAAAGILAKVQQEDGFERYDYYLSAADPDELLIVEEWDSEAQQQAHVNTDHMAQLRAIKEKHVASTAMQRIAKADWPPGPSAPRRPRCCRPGCR